MGSPDSRAWCFRACCGVSDRAGSRCLSRLRCIRFRLPLCWDVVGSLYCPLRHKLFRGSIPSPRVPLSTLRLGLCRPWRMTRGRCGSLSLHRMTLSFTTPRQFSSAHPNLPYTDQRGGWKLTKLNPAGLFCLRRSTVLLPPQTLSSFHAAFSQRGSSSVNILLSRMSAKSTRMSLRITAQSASVFWRGRSHPFFLCS